MVGPLHGEHYYHQEFFSFCRRANLLLNGVVFTIALVITTNSGFSGANSNNNNNNAANWFCISIVGNCVWLCPHLLLVVVALAILSPSPGHLSACLTTFERTLIYFRIQISINLRSPQALLYLEHSASFRLSQIYSRN